MIIHSASSGEKPTEHLPRKPAAGLPRTIHTRGLRPRRWEEIALVKKGSRGIAVDGTRYRWTVRRKPTYCQGNEWVPFAFAVEHHERTGSVLVTYLPCAHPESWMLGRSTAVRPALVASAIRTGLTRGWTPLQPGSAFHLELTEQELPEDTVWFTADI